MASINKINQGVSIFSIPEDVLEQVVLRYLDLKDKNSFFKVVPSIARKRQFRLINLCFHVDAINTALKVAVKTNNLVDLKEIISKRLKDLDIKDLEIAFCIACKNNVEMVKAFIACFEFNKLIPASVGEGLFIAAREGNVEMTKAIISSYLIKPEDLGQAFWIAAKKGHIKVVTLLMGDNKFIHISAKNLNFAVQLAIEGAHTEIVKLIMTNNHFKMLRERNAKPSFFERRLLPACDMI